MIFKKLFSAPEPSRLDELMQVLSLIESTAHNVAAAEASVDAAASRPVADQGTHDHRLSPPARAAGTTSGREGPCADPNGLTSCVFDFSAELRGDVPTANDA